MLLEAMIAILIFSMGILAIVGLQSTAIRASSEAKYRSDACLLANQLIGQMWVSDRTSSTLQANFSSNSAGAAYVAWKGSGSPPAAGSVLAVLPGAAANPPVVSFQTVTNATSATTSSLVTITLFWQPPGSAHVNRYRVIAQII
jgi:type IV pilus assembly protein PilV